MKEKETNIFRQRTSKWYTKRNKLLQFFMSFLPYLRAPGETTIQQN